MAVWSQFGLQEGISLVMQLMNSFHDYMMMLMTVIMVFVSYVFVLVLMSRSTDKYLVDSHFLELIWTLVPMFFLVFMAFPSLYLLYMTEDYQSPSVTFKVIGHQWYWEYEYSFLGSTFSFDSYMVHPDLSSSTIYRCLDVDNRLAIPVMSSSLALVTSADVLHSWTIPALGVKADATPGRLNFLNLFPTQSGVFYGQCSELCGSNHSFMPIVAEVLQSSCFINFLSNLE